MTQNPNPRHKQANKILPRKTRFFRVENPHLGYQATLTQTSSPLSDEWAVVRSSLGLAAPPSDSYYLLPSRDLALTFFRAILLHHPHQPLHKKSNSHGGENPIVAFTDSFHPVPSFILRIEKLQTPTTSNPNMTKLPSSTNDNWKLLNMALDNIETRYNYRPGRQSASNDNNLRDTGYTQRDTTNDDSCPETLRSTPNNLTLFLSRNNTVGIPYVDVLHSISLCMHFKSTSLGCSAFLTIGHDGGEAPGTGGQRTIVNPVPIGISQVVFDRSTKPISIAATIEEVFFEPGNPASQELRQEMQLCTTLEPWSYLLDAYEP
jgi:hypothetical protein